MDMDPSFGARPTWSSNDVAIMRLKESVDELAEEVRELRYIVIGNGDPSNSLVSKMDGLLGAWEGSETWQDKQNSMAFRLWLWHVSTSILSAVNFVWLLLLTWITVTR